MITLETCTKLTCEKCKETEVSSRSEDFLHASDSPPMIHAHQLVQTAKQGALDSGWHLVDGKYFCEECMEGSPYD